MLQLREYQSECIAKVLTDLSELRDSLVVLATGTGKSEIFFELCRQYHLRWPQKKILIIVPKVMLHQQTVDRMIKDFPSDLIGQVCGTLGRRDHSKPVTIGTVKSIGSIVPDVVIVDEAHNWSPTYVKLFNKLRSLKNDMRIVAFTATPFKNGIGKIYGQEEKRPFKQISFTKPFEYFFENKWLVPPIMKMPSEAFDTSKLKIRAGDYRPEELAALVQEDKIKKQIADALPRLTGRKKIAWACVNIFHCELLERLLSDAGESAVAIHSKQKRSVNEEHKAAFVKGPVRNMVFVSMLSEGINIPEIDAIVFMRPTKSPTLYVQVCGRGLRPFEGKDNCLILDFGRVVENCGFLDDPNIFEKDDKKKKEEKFKVCPTCQSIVKVMRKKCPDCGHEFVSQETDYVKNLTVKHKEGTLFKKDVKEQIEIIPVRQDVNIKYSKTSTGKECFIITYTPKNMFKRPIREWAVRGTPYFSQKFNRLGLKVFNWVDAFPEYMNKTIQLPIEDLHVDMSGKFPNIKRVIYAHQ